VRLEGPRLKLTLGSPLDGRERGELRVVEQRRAA
jgi:hypothetical protein